MSDPYVGEIKMFAGNFAPRSYALCNGQLLPISQNTALFSILGTTYGGDGRTTFGLPDLQNRAPLHRGQGAGLTERSLGVRAGESAVTLISSEMPLHNHQMQCNTAAGNTTNPSGATFGVVNGRGRPALYASQGTVVPMAPQALAPTGGNQPHNNLQPYLCVTFIIALQGVFPPRD